ncbi:MAG: hypothetical protein DMG23_05965 [Acidobacteria bacterium]|nr:MAG: hypothetical protein DMG23_05965 [Acidobacteriota bacterium]
MKRVGFCIAGLIIVFGCGPSQSKSAVRAAIEAYLRQRPNLVLSNMTFDVQEVKFHGDTAEAEVKFESKESPDLAVKVHYVLQKSGDHWVVRSSSPACGMGGPHSSAARESQTRPQEGGSTAGEPEPQSCH